jgi:hypothetical protein
MQAPRDVGPRSPSTARATELEGRHGSGCDARLLERAGDLQPFDVFHFGRHWFERGIELAETTREAAGADVRIASFPSFAVYLAAPARARIECQALPTAAVLPCS